MLLLELRPRSQHLLQLPDLQELPLGRAEHHPVHPRPLQLRHILCQYLLQQRRGLQVPAGELHLRRRDHLRGEPVDQGGGRAEG